MEEVRENGVLLQLVVEHRSSLRSSDPKLSSSSKSSAEGAGKQKPASLVVPLAGVGPVFVPLSQLDTRRVAHASALGLVVGKLLHVKCFGRDPVSGVLRLSRKALLATPSALAHPQRVDTERVERAAAAAAAATQGAQSGAGAAAGAAGTTTAGPLTSGAKAISTSTAQHNGLPRGGSTSPKQQQKQTDASYSPWSSPNNKP